MDVLIRMDGWFFQKPTLEFHHSKAQLVQE
jgi:hypothetical protein